MSRKLASTVAVAAVFGIATATSGAVATKTVKMKLGDEFVVKKTHIVCTAQLSKTLIPGRKLMGCLFADSKGPLPKTYAVGLAADGEAVLAKVQADRTPKVISRRKLSVVRRDAANPKLYTLSPGDAVLVTGTALACAVNKSKAIVVTCFLFDFKNNRARPNAYGIGITDGGAFLVHFDKDSKPTIIQSKKHGT